MNMQGPKIPRPGVQDAFNRMVTPGLQAQATANNLLNTGRVKDVTITSGAYSCTVTQTSRYGPLVDVPDVQAAVPVSVGDVVSLEYIQGNPLLGVYCVPVRPKGPNVLSWTGTVYDGASIPLERRGTNSVFESYVIPVSTIRNPATYPLVISGASEHPLFTVPIQFRIQYPRTAVGISVSYRIKGGVHVPSFAPTARNFPIRDLGEIFQIQVRTSDGEVINALRVQSVNEFDDVNPLTISTGKALNVVLFGPNTYVAPTAWESIQDNPSIQRYILDTQDLTHIVGQDLTIAAVAKVSFNDFQLRWLDTRNANISQRPWRYLYADGPTDSGGSTVPFTFWRGVSDVEITLVEVGTGNA